MPAQHTSVSITLQNIGLANLFWNKVEELWYLYFTGLVEGVSRGEIEAIYHTHESGHRKRLLIQAVANAKFGQGSERAKLLDRLMDRTKSASQTRNALMHGSYYLSTSESGGDLGISNPSDGSKRSKLAGKALFNELHAYVALLKELINDVELFMDGPPYPPDPNRLNNCPGVLTTARLVNLIDWVLEFERTKTRPPMPEWIHHQSQKFCIELAA